MEERKRNEILTYAQSWILYLSSPTFPRFRWYSFCQKITKTRTFSARLKVHILYSSLRNISILVLHWPQILGGWAISLN